MKKTIILSALAIMAFGSGAKADRMLQIFRNGEVIGEYPVTDIEYIKFKEVPTSVGTDLSAKEMANCYIVQEEGEYRFKADNRFNLGEGLPVPPEIHPVDARLIWQTVKGSIRSVEFEEGSPIPYIKFDVARASGNALIAALDKDGNIVWSWHIWMPENEVGSVHTSTGYDLMTMNLGAINNTAGDPGAYGMLYQWGRKDPFPAAATLTGTTATVSAPMYDIDGNPVTLKNSSWYNTNDNNLEYSIANPTVVLSNYSQYSKCRDWLADGSSDDTLWGNPYGYERDTTSDSYLNKGRKTCYDPSPAGWRVAPADAFRDFTSSGGYAWDFADFNLADTNKDGNIDILDYNYGWEFNVNSDTTLYFPAAARFDGSYAMLMGSMSGLWGNYWSNSPHSSMAGGAFCNLSFSVKDQNGIDFISISPAAASSRADAFSIRCIRDN